MPKGSDNLTISPAKLIGIQFNCFVEQLKPHDIFLSKTIFLPLDLLIDLHCSNIASRPDDINFTDICVIWADPVVELNCTIRF